MKIDFSSLYKYKLKMFEVYYPLTSDADDYRNYLESLTTQISHPNCEYIKSNRLSIINHTHHKLLIHIYSEQKLKYAISYVPKFNGIKHIVLKPFLAVCLPFLPEIITLPLLETVDFNFDALEEDNKENEKAFKFAFGAVKSLKLSFILFMKILATT